MGTLGNPKIWVPYINPKDCTQGFCSISCPQWCYLIFPPPPPPSSMSFPLDSSSSSTTFSPLVIIIIGVLASALLLVSYYAILSKYCGNSESSRRVGNQESSQDDDDDDIEDEQNDTTNEHGPWLISTTGLDEPMIKKITLVKYKKGDGMVGSGDCSVCLGEFQDDESLRLLPKCSHAFHVGCIDTWLRSHSNCPLCRASIFSTNTQSPPQIPPPLVVDHSHHHPPQDHEQSTQTHIENEQNRRGDQEEQSSINLPKSPFRSSGSTGIHEGIERQKIRRSISMDHCHETRLSISNALTFDSKEAAAGETSKSIDDGNKETTGNGGLNYVMNSVTIKRSFSSGRFLFMTKHGRGNNAVIPL